MACAVVLQENVKVVGGPSSDRLEQGSTALATEQQSCQSDTSCSQGPQQRPLPPHQHPGYADPSAAFPPVSNSACDWPLSAGGVWHK
jgi:hypothetical protein